MKELNNNSIVSLNQQVLGASQQGVVRPRSEGYLKYKAFAGKYAKEGDVLVKFRDPKSTASELRAANIKDDGFFGCDMIGPFFRRKVTKDANNNVRKDFVKSLVDSFGDVNLFSALNEKEIADMKLADFIGADALKAATESGRLMLSELVGKTTIGKPLSSRRITAITTAFENYEARSLELSHGNASRQEPVVTNGSNKPVEIRTEPKKPVTQPKHVSNKLAPESITDERARKIVRNIFTTWAWPNDNDDGAEAIKSRLDKIHEEGQDPKPLKINICDSEGSSYENVATGKELRTKLHNVVKDDLVTGFLLKFLSRVSRFGVDSFLYDGIEDCYGDYRANKKPYKTPIVVDLKIIDSGETKKDIITKRVAGNIVLKVSEGEGDDRRTATATFKLSDYSKCTGADLPIDKVENVPVLKFTSGPSDS